MTGRRIVYVQGCTGTSVHKQTGPTEIAPYVDEAVSGIKIEIYGTVKTDPAVSFGRNLWARETPTFDRVRTRARCPVRSSRSVIDEIQYIVVQYACETSFLRLQKRHLKAPALRRQATELYGIER